MDCISYASFGGGREGEKAAPQTSVPSAANPFSDSTGRNFLPRSLCVDDRRLASAQLDKLFKSRLVERTEFDQTQAAMMLLFFFY